MLLGINISSPFINFDRECYTTALDFDSKNGLERTIKIYLQRLTEDEDGFIYFH